MKKIVVTIIKGGKAEPETIVTIPIDNIGIVDLLIPKDALTVLRKDGLNLNEIIRAAKKEDLEGNLIEIQKPDIKISLAVTKVRLTKRDK